MQKQEIDKLRIEYGIGMDTAREMIIEPRIYRKNKKFGKAYSGGVNNE